MLTDTDELETAWAALGNQRTDSGLLTIALGHANPRFRGGIVFPDGAETLLAGFNAASPPAKSDLPDAAGFKVTISNENFAPGFSFWICVTRKPGGGRDLFVQMAADIVAAVSGASAKSDSFRMLLMLARIRAWQQFMQRPRSDLLSPEEELGLVGELSVLRNLLQSGAAPEAAVQAWVGPRGELQDFRFSTVALEAKSTLSSNGFPAEISSLEQLDDADGRAILLAGLRFCLHETGTTLPELVEQIKTTLASAPQALGSLARGLLLVGFLDDHARHYVRRFALLDIRTYEVDETFPALRRSAVPPGIRKAAYVIDLDLVDQKARTFDDAIVTYGVLSE